MIDLLVVGAGIAGSCVARAGRAAGLEVALLAPPDRPPASRCAICVMRRAWRPPAERPAYDCALSLYSRLGAVIARTADVLGTAGWEERSDWVLIDPRKVLLEPEPGEWAPARWTVRCTAFGGRAPMRRTVGSTAVLPAGALRNGPALQIIPTARRAHAAAAAFADGGRIGSSTAPSKEEAVARCSALVSRFVAAGTLDEDAAASAEYISGSRAVRLKPPVDGCYWEQTGAGEWWMGGFGKNGFALAPAAAQSLVAALKS